MQYEILKEFLVKKMKMSHIYQPVMIKHLLQNNGCSVDKQIAKDISLHDPSQLEYYQAIVNNMVGRVLRSHSIVGRQKNEYCLNHFDTLSDSERDELIAICDEKIQAYINKRGDSIWQHRTKNRRPVPGSIRFEVLKRAQFRCELCGISAEERALEVDHIVPVNLGGIDSINNYQALCYSCNATKRDTDKTDFRNTSAMYGHRSQDCVFCSLPTERIVETNNLAVWIYDSFPVAVGHSLIIPKRHCADYFEVTQAEINAINALMRIAKKELERSDKHITGFNIGINSGLAAGQTIFHSHTHLIPRRKDDVQNPTGGVRNIIPGKGAY